MLTQTQANHICNIGKETIAEIQSRLDEISFISESIQQDGKELPLTEGCSNFQDISVMIHQIGIINSFIAYMRESIKELQHKQDIINRCTFDVWMKSNNYICNSPVFKEVTFEEIFANKSIKERQEYFYEEAMASTIGKFIHPNQPFSRARLKAFKCKPGELVNNIYHKFTITIPIKTIDDVFFQLQSSHRQHEAKLNALKHSIEIQVNQENSILRSDYQKSLKEYETNYNEYANKHKDYKLLLMKELQNTKIEIPINLKEIYDTLNNLGK